MRSIIFDLISPKRVGISIKQPWHHKALGYFGMGIGIIFILTFLAVIIAVGIWAVKYIWSAI